MEHEVELIAAKRDGRELTADDLRQLIHGFARGDLPDYQLTAFLMAGYVRGFTHAETVAMTEAMVGSGNVLDLSSLSGPTVDKHSTGGVGDGTTLVVAPLAAALGMQVVKLSGRGLGHTGGTLDKLESIPGMRVDLSIDEVLSQVRRIGLAVSAQTTDLVPADRAIYALRDVTATVDSVPLIAASVMSKKLAGGAGTILLDVKAGSGAFMKDMDCAQELARACVDLGQAAGRTTGALITDMSQPLGAMIGNAIEVREVIEVLRGERTGRFLDLCLALTAHLAWFSGRAAELPEAERLAQRALETGEALEHFQAFVEAQGGDPRIVDDVSLLPTARVVREIRAPGAGCLAGVDAEGVGNAAGGLGSGRHKKDDVIDAAAGIELLVKIGDEVTASDLLGRIFASSDEAAARAERQILDSMTWGDEPQAAPELIREAIHPTGESPQKPEVLAG
ncbi:MAG: thymidine phosphorylase [Solirubrobacterales bacterium]|nr:thymidine phosphorylase [Solirubrobacterales bacterium]